MRKFTLDTNCIIDLEDERPDAIFVRQIVQAWKDGQIELAVVAVTASENQLSGTSSSTFADFENKLEKVGLGGLSTFCP